MKDAVRKLNAWWSSQQSTLIGLLSVVCGLVTDAGGAKALVTIGIPAAIVAKAAAAAVVIGLLLITPKKAKDA